MADFSVAVLISGRGSNLRSLLLGANNFKVSAIVSDKGDAPGLAFGAEFGVTTVVRERKDFPNLKSCKQAIFEAVRDLRPDLVCLAGFMQIIEPYFVEHFKGRLINIHPSLLPDFPGLHTHQRAIDAKATAHGCTVHYVDSGVDTGPMIAQARVEVLPHDTEQTLAARVLEQEHRIYPWVVGQIAAGNISLNERTVVRKPQVTAEAAQLGFVVP